MTNTISRGAAKLLGCAHSWSDGGATDSPIKKFSHTIVFDAAFEGDQSVGPTFDQLRLSLHIPKTRCTQGLPFGSQRDEFRDQFVELTEGAIDARPRSPVRWT